MRATVRSPLLAAAACFLGFGVVLGCAYAIAPMGRLDAIALHGLTALDNPVSDRLGPRRGALGRSTAVAGHAGCALRLGMGAGPPARGHRRGRAGGGRQPGRPDPEGGARAPSLPPVLGGDQVGAEAFPSGHATSAMSIALAAVLVAPARRARCRRLRRCGLRDRGRDFASRARLALPQRRPGRAAALLRLLLLGCRRRSRGRRWRARAPWLRERGWRSRRGSAGLGVAVLAGASRDRPVCAQRSCSPSRACTRWPPRRRSPSRRSRPACVASATLIADATRLGWPGSRSAAGAPSAGSTFSLPDAVYLQRHGDDRYVLPHRIDHLANMRSLAEAGCDRVLALGSVGGLRRELGAGDVRLPRRLHRARTPGRPAFDDERAHTRARIRSRAGGAGSSTPGATGSARTIVDGGVYWQTRGPRLRDAGRDPPDRRRTPTWSG